MSDSIWANTITDPRSISPFIQSTLTRPQKKQLRACLLELSIPNIDDPLKAKFAQVLSNPNIESVEAITYFTERSPFWWHAREWARFIVGYHRPIPIPNVNIYADFARHFPHISREDPMRVAVMMDPKKAEQDVHTTMKIGRYMSKQTNAPEALIPDIANGYANRNITYKVEIATTRAEIQWVYEHGPDSCMGKTMAAFRCKAHPTQPYATPDFKIMYIRDLENPSRVIARTVYSNINRQFVRIFGNVALMKRELANIGITGENRVLRNHRLLKITEKVGGATMHVGPYLDCNVQNIYQDTRDDEYLIINPRDRAHRGKHIGATSRSYSGKGYIDTSPALECSECSNEYDSSAMHSFLEYDESYHLCNDCHADYTVIVTDRDLDDVRVPEFFARDNMYSVTEYLHNGPNKSRSKYFYSKPTFDDAISAEHIFEYRNTGMYISMDNAAYIKDKAMYVHCDELVWLNYCAEGVLQDQAIRLNGMWMAKKHLVNSKFAFDTISKINIDEITRTPEIFYYQAIVKPGSNDTTRLYATDVSRTPKKGFKSYNDLWLQQVADARGFDTYASIGIADLSRLFIMYLPPDDPKQLMYNKENKAALYTFCNSSIAKSFVAHPAAIRTTLDDYRVIQTQRPKIKRRQISASTSVPAF